MFWYQLHPNTWEDFHVYATNSAPFSLFYTLAFQSLCRRTTGRICLLYVKGQCPGKERADNSHRRNCLSIKTCSQSIERFKAVHPQWREFCSNYRTFIFSWWHKHRAADSNSASTKRADTPWITFCNVHSLSDSSTGQFTLQPSSKVERVNTPLCHAGGA